MTEYKGKVYGYSRSEFIVDDVLYYIVKRVKGTIEGDMCEVTDDEIISYNFPKLLDKKVKVSSTFRRDKNDSTWYLAGKWKTNVTKKYYSVSGKVDLEQENDLTASKIFPHLEELKLADEIVFYKERKEGVPVVKIAKPEKITFGYSSRTEPFTPNNDMVAISDKPIIQKAESKPTGVSSTTSVNELNKTLAISSSTEIITAVENLPTGQEDLPTIKKTSDELPKTATKNIPAATVPVLSSSSIPAPATKSLSANKNPDIVAEPEKNNSVATTSTPATEEKEILLLPTTKTVATQEAPLVKTHQQVTIPAGQNKANNTPVTKTNAPVSNAVTKNNAAPKNEVIVSAPVKTNTDVINNSIAEKKISRPDEMAGSGKTIVTPIPLNPETKNPTLDVTLKAAIIAGRKSEFSQVVNFKSDSLQVSLYDNGEIDGDTVSVFMNGEVIWAKQGLKSSAIRKTIYLASGKDDEFTLVLFAENLGKYPPNTGLLVVRDGDDVYNLRFSSDFEKNTGIVFRRKK